jgi:hypothetical protein
MDGLAGKMRRDGRNLFRNCALGVRKWAFERPLGWRRYRCAPMAAGTMATQPARKSSEIDNFADNTFGGVQ